jgi:hypothetical protein
MTTPERIGCKVNSGKGGLPLTNSVARILEPFPVVSTHACDIADVVVCGFWFWRSQMVAAMREGHGGDDVCDTVALAR